ncbi:uncharacterized protein ARMOST_00368 [Armillaria ostoyae]|uniref:Uncharacterized protein n=1 Tax=Armillaria ostoyae TaxID=47428 RepID=A0A284QKX9_ARMOS|nr:uncharacterized protein ARMOST_00368 [Armillaria ostoyae]
MFSHEKIKATEPEQHDNPRTPDVSYSMPAHILRSSAILRLEMRLCFLVDREGLRSRQHDGGQANGEKARSASRNELTPSVSTCKAIPFILSAPAIFQTALPIQLVHYCVSRHSEERWTKQANKHRFRQTGSVNTFTEQNDDGGSLEMRKGATAAASSASIHRENETMSGFDSD